VFHHHYQQQPTSPITITQPNTRKPLKLRPSHSFSREKPQLLFTTHRGQSQAMLVQRLIRVRMDSAAATIMLCIRLVAPIMTVLTQQWLVTSATKPSNNSHPTQTIGHSQAQQHKAMAVWPTKVTQIHMELVKALQGRELAQKAE